MSKKILKIFVLPPQDDAPVKLFAKLNWNHLLMANIFKLQGYQTFGLMKMHNISKTWFDNNKFNLWKKFGLMV